MAACAADCGPRRCHRTRFSRRGAGAADRWWAVERTCKSLDSPGYRATNQSDQSCTDGRPGNRHAQSSGGQRTAHIANVANDPAAPDANIENPVDDNTGHDNYRDDGYGRDNYGHDDEHDSHDYGHDDVDDHWSMRSARAHEGTRIRPTVVRT
jgi:hypothetical protein